MVKLWFLKGRDTIAEMRVRRREFVIRNIIGNRVFCGSSIALIGLKIRRWFRNSSRSPRERITKNRTSWKRIRSMVRFNGQRRRSKIRNRSSNVFRNKNKQILWKINKIFFKNSRINRS